MFTFPIEVNQTDELRVFLRINSNERVPEERNGSANAVEDGSGIGKSGEGEGEGEGDEKGDEKVVLLEAFTDEKVGVKLVEVERGLASSEES